VIAEGSRQQPRPPAPTTNNAQQPDSLRAGIARDVEPIPRAEEGSSQAVDDTRRDVPEGDALLKTSSPETKYTI
jgi:hypothetical protein